MLDTLAKLADLKLLLGYSGTENDVLLLQLLERATAAAEQLVGRPLARRADITEYPAASVSGEHSQTLMLRRPPIESITSIKQLYTPGSVAEFTTATALAEITDYIVHQPDAGDAFNMARIERINATWYLRPRCVQVIYTGGFADPARVGLGLATATWTEATKTLTQTGAFANYTFAPGDSIIITGGTGATAGTYRIASHTSDDAIVLTESISSAAVDLATGDITSLSSGGASGGGIDAPQDLQSGILAQATMAWNTKDKAGLREIDLGDAGGKFSTVEMKTHPALAAACQRLWRYTL